MGGRPLLDGADLTVDPGRRIGLVGRNGAGKSTLLRAIAGELPLDGGDIRLAARAPAATGAQEAPSGVPPCWRRCCRATPNALALLARGRDAPTPTGWREIHERLRAIGADAAPARAAAILAGLGFDEAAQARPVESFSGGWRMRVALATALFANPDLLLLDEPTNHLDLEATLWLETWLARFPGRRCWCRTIAGCWIARWRRSRILTAARSALTPGGFDEFVRIRTERAMQQASAAERIAARARAHPVLRRSLPLQGEQGAPGAVAASRRWRGCRRSRR